MMELDILDITAAKKHQFEQKGIVDVKTLLNYLPRKYNDYSHITGVLPEDEVSCVFVTLKSVETFKKTVSMTIAKCICDTGERINVQWFNQPWMAGKLTPYKGRKFFLASKLEGNPAYGSYNAVQPDVFSADLQEAMKIYPVYSKIPGMSADYLQDKINLALKTGEANAEFLPEDLRLKYGLLDIRGTYLGLHDPKKQEDIEAGQKRCIFNDLLDFSFQNELARKGSAVTSKYKVKNIKLVRAVKKSLPYTLTKDQDKAVSEMIEKAKRGTRINALIQGDVGCGKTIVAMIMAAAMAGSGYQTVIMAPTQVLARQHYNDAKSLFEPLGIQTVFLGGEKLKKAEQTRLLNTVSSGEAKIIVGTHAVFSKDVVYDKLGLVITDEEHKFGVLQRQALVEKASKGVHCITMSATPIPRSLAHILYGDEIQLHTIMTMPAGRKKVITGIGKSREKIFRFIRSQVGQGHQIYVVCPMIDPSDSEMMANVRSVEEVSAEYKKVLAPCGIHIATLTGKNTKEETDAILDEFKNGRTDVLIATTVIEVGVNVPNATAIIITNAERFGLAQLHQLRGRVGRGSFQSYCVLDTDAVDEKSRKRLDALCRLSDGFEIAQADLEQRGAGDFLGTRQSGENKYISLMLAYPQIYQNAKECAEELLLRRNAA